MTTFVYVHSADRVLGGTPSNFSIQLPQPLQFTGKSRIRVDNIRIPNTYKTIDEGNKYLYLNIAGADAVRTLGVGNYNATQIGTMFASYIDGSSTSSVYDAVNNTLMLTYQPGGRFQIHPLLHGRRDRGGAVHGRLPGRVRAQQAQQLQQHPAERRQREERLSELARVLQDQVLFRPAV